MQPNAIVCRLWFCFFFKNTVNANEKWIQYMRETKSLSFSVWILLYPFTPALYFAFQLCLPLLHTQTHTLSLTLAHTHKNIFSPYLTELVPSSVLILMSPFSLLLLLAFSFSRSSLAQLNIKSRLWCNNLIHHYPELIPPPPILSFRSGHPFKRFKRWVFYPS